MVQTASGDLFVFIIIRTGLAADAPLVGIRPGLLLVGAGLAADAPLVGIRPGLLLVGVGLAADAPLVGIRPGLLLVGAGLARSQRLKACSLSRTLPSSSRQGSCPAPARRNKFPLDSHARIRSLVSAALCFILLFLTKQASSLRFHGFLTPVKIQSMIG